MASPNLKIDNPALGRINCAFGVIGLLVGIAFLAGGGWLIHHSRLDQFLGLLAKSQTAEGTVIENRAIEVNPSSTSHTLPYVSYQAIVAFVDRSGRSITLPDPLAFNPPSFFVGQKVRIFYDPQSPERGMIDRGRKNLIEYYVRVRDTERPNIAGVPAVAELHRAYAKSWFENPKFVVGADLSAAQLCSDPTGNSWLGLRSSGSIVVRARLCFRSSRVAKGFAGRRSTLSHPWPP